MCFLSCLVEATGPATRIRIVGMPDETAWTIAEGARWTAPLVQRGVQRIDLGIRAEHLRVLDRADSNEAALVARTVVRRLEPHGAETMATLALGAHVLSVRLPGRTPVGVGAPLAAALGPAGIVWFDPDSGRALS